MAEVRRKRLSGIAEPFRTLVGYQGSSRSKLTSDRYLTESGNSQAVQAPLPNSSKHLIEDTGLHVVVLFNYGETLSWR
jgi:hypothetical protein